MSTLKVGTIQDHANSTTALTIDSSGKVDAPVLGSLTRNVPSFCAIGPSTYTNYGASGVMSYNNTTSVSGLIIVVVPTVQVTVNLLVQLLDYIILKQVH